MKYFQFLTLAKVPGLLHDISTRSYGDLKPDKLTQNFEIKLNENQISFFRDLEIPNKNVVFMEQIHGNDVASVDKDCSRKWIPEADALVTTEQNLFLCANTADCVPVLFVEPTKKITAIAHAGWKGTLGKIAKKVVERIIKTGGQKEKIKIGIGPAIGPCCYNVAEDRFLMFQKHFGENESIIKRDGQYFLDLKGLNAKILIDAGLNSDQIEISPDCTSCQNDLYFSYRKDKKETYGEMMSVIGFIS